MYTTNKPVFLSSPDDESSRSSTKSSDKSNFMFEIKKTLSNLYNLGPAMLPSLMAFEQAPTEDFLKKYLLNNQHIYQNSAINMRKQKVKYPTDTIKNVSPLH